MTSARPYPGRDRHDVTRPVPDPGYLLRPTWEICRWCRVQLYEDPRFEPGALGHRVPRLHPGQARCPASDPPGRAHDTDLGDERARLGRPQCDEFIAIDGPRRPRIHCPRRAVRRIIPLDDRGAHGARGGRGAGQGCHLHFPAMLDRVQADARRRESLARLLPDRPQGPLPAPDVVDIVYERTTRDRAHGRAGRWITRPVEHVIRHQLF